MSSTAEGYVWGEHCYPWYLVYWEFASAGEPEDQHGILYIPVADADEISVEFVLDNLATNGLDPSHPQAAEDLTWVLASMTNLSWDKCEKAAPQLVTRLVHTLLPIT